MSQFRALERYAQGAGALAAADEHLSVVEGTEALVVGGETALSNTEEQVLAGLSGAGIDHRGTVRGISQSTEERIGDITAQIDATGADVVVGVGGCTAIDAAKAAAIRRDTEFVAIPTLASADGPAGGLAVVYDENDAPVDVEFRERNPELVLVDTGVVAEAPVHVRRWGIGDSISTAFEARACARSGATTIHGDETSETGRVLAEQVYEALDEHGRDALDGVERDEVTPALEAVVETIHLTSVLAWENAGLGGAHALESGLRASGITEPPHGIFVGLCTIAEAVWQEDSDHRAVAELLAELGFEDPIPEGADLEPGIALACEVDLMDNEPVDVTPDIARDALATARDALATANE
jgi:glycerol dehydrogenase